MKRRTAILIILGSLLLGLSAATQVVARQLVGRELGPHVNVAGVAVYPPWSLLEWHQAWASEHPRAFRYARAIVAAHGTGAVVLVGILKGRQPTVRPIGTRQWANLRAIKDAGLLSGRGVVVGRYAGRLLTYDGPEHQLGIGASRSGKGVGLVVPTLLNWLESAVVYDIKGELWKITSGFRGQFSHCLFFDPTRLDSARYNPLLEVRKGPNEIRDVQIIAEMLVNPDGTKQQLDVWDQHAQQLLVSYILYVLYVEPDGRKHLGVVRQLLLEFDKSARDLIEIPHRLNPDTGEPQPHPEIAWVARELLRQAPKFAAGVRATALGYLALFADEIVCRNISESDFAISDLVCGDRPVTLYIQPPPSDLPRLRPLTRLLFNQLFRCLLEHTDTDNRGRPKRHKLLAELDEFPTLGRMEFLAINLRQMAGYGIKAHMIVQSFNDIISQYGPYQSIIDNSHVMTVFGCADSTTQQRVSQMTGMAVEYRDSFSHRRMPLFAPDSVQQGEQVRPLLQPGDVRTLPGDEELIFVTGHPPIRAKKVRYYADAAFKGRVLPPPDQSQGIDVPHANVPSDWRGERAKGDRIRSDEVFDQRQLDDEDWMPEGMPPVDQAQDRPGAAGNDEYAI